MAEIDDKVKELQKPFSVDDLEWRVQSAGETKKGGLYAIVVPYVTNRAVQDRLDAVMGVTAWKNEFTSTPNGKGTLCGISILVGNEWITKWDGSEDSDIEAVKGGLSGAMKRAAVQWGIGRYLYKLDAVVVTPQTDKPQTMEGWIMAQVKLNAARKERIYYRRPKLPEWALPKE